MKFGKLLVLWVSVIFTLSACSSGVTPNEPWYKDWRWCSLMGAAVGGGAGATDDSDAAAVGAGVGAVLGALLCWGGDEAMADEDGDGVADEVDACPFTPQGLSVDERGCPLDDDGDWVPNDVDKCPDTPKGTKVDSDGCPADSDGDGVVDGQDACPNTPPNTDVDAKGCSILAVVHINFANNSSAIPMESESELDQIAQILNDDELIRIEVAGHTDGSGTDEYNMMLSEQRAESVKMYLMDRGVSADRMTSIGYGKAHPVASNSTAEGRQSNRRVEIIRVE